MTAAVLIASAAVAQPGKPGSANGPEEPPLCDAACQETCQKQACDEAEDARRVACPAVGLAAYRICNNDLQDVSDFVPTVYDGNCNIDQKGTTGMRVCAPNLAAASVLSRLDIDDDDVADVSPDTDGDGLPDNWELGGIETSEVMEDRVVFFPAPSAIVPGTPPTPVFTRRAVATSALLPDTDDDDLSDFIEVFGLMFIDDNRNGILDNKTEWEDFNGDGLPSPGEYPVDGTPGITGPEGFPLRHDFDGFVFTDPTNPDTDGDGVPDGADTDPLINPRAFGIAGRIIVRFEAEDNPDIDQDGLGNGMDMGNDLLPDEAPDLLRFQVIDNPENLRELLSLFREDLLAEGIVPESAIEDLLGADWDGNGLWRTTDVRLWSLLIDPTDETTKPPDDLFQLEGGTVLYSPQKLNDEDLTDAERRAGRRSLTAVFNDPDFERYGKRGIGLGWQEVLKPPSTSEFIPDKRVWAILYAWRMPGFDIDGDGFIGAANLTGTAEGTEEGLAMVALRRRNRNEPYVLTDQVPLESSNGTCSRGICSGGENDGDSCSTDADCITVQPFDDRIPIGLPEPVDPQLNGVVEAPPGLSRVFQNLGCGAIGLGMLMGMTLVLMISRFKAPSARC